MHPPTVTREGMRHTLWQQKVMVHVGGIGHSKQFDVYWWNTWRSEQYRPHFTMRNLRSRRVVGSFASKNAINRLKSEQCKLDVLAVRTSELFGHFLCTKTLYHVHFETRSKFLSDAKSLICVQGSLHKTPLGMQSHRVKLAAFRVIVAWGRFRLDHSNANVSRELFIDLCSTAWDCMEKQTKSESANNLSKVRIIRALNGSCWKHFVSFTRSAFLIFW